jgi:hypothetical protein
MSSLKAIEKRSFEDLFDMASGYVLEFSNNTFAEFFRESAKVNIYDERYAFNGDSKAKRLRAFLEIEPDKLVGKVLSDLLEVWEYENSGQVAENPKYEKCKQIAARLNGSTPGGSNTEKDFLKRTIELPSLAKLQLDPVITTILEGRLKEIEKGLNTHAALSVIFMCGSLLEGVLLGTALKSPEAFNRSSSSPKYSDGKVKPFHEWKLAQFIDVACDIKVVQLDVKKFSHALRDFRNYIHPYEQMASGFSPDQHTADICFQVLKAALADLSKER